jgi:hypothetical protein
MEIQKLRVCSFILRASVRDGVFIHEWSNFSRRNLNFSRRNLNFSRRNTKLSRRNSNFSRRNINFSRSNVNFMSISVGGTSLYLSLKITLRQRVSLETTTPTTLHPPSTPSSLRVRRLTMASNAAPLKDSKAKEVLSKDILSGFVPDSMTEKEV